jgi:TPR repeat protein
MKYILLLTVLLTSTAFAAPDLDKNMAAAEQGNANAQFNLGLMYSEGIGVPENDAEAVKWYRKAAEQGHAEAESNLGWMYANGYGVPENDAEAVKWYRKAADQGQAVAQYNLGNMYYNGDGVPENSIRAYVWLSMAKTQGDTDAAKYLDKLKPTMTNQQIAEAQALATQCYESDYKDCD